MDMLKNFFFIQKIVLDDERASSLHIQLVSYFSDGAAWKICLYKLQSHLLLC